VNFVCAYGVLFRSLAVMLCMKDADVEYDFVLYIFREWWMVITGNFRHNMADKYKN
jgi:hypothetical protein